MAILNRVNVPVGEVPTILFTAAAIVLNANLKIVNLGSAPVSIELYTVIGSNPATVPAAKDYQLHKFTVRGGSSVMATGICAAIGESLVVKTSLTSSSCSLMLFDLT